MKIFRDLNFQHAEERPVALTIGYFDGIHRGHQWVLNSLKTVAKEHAQKTAVITFENHPAEVLLPSKKIQNLITMEHKIKLFEEHRIDYLIILKFTKELAEMTAEDFLKAISNPLPFSQLVLGHDAVFGKGKDGTKERVRDLGLKHHFNVEYLEPFKIENMVASSTLIRNFLQSGNLQMVEKLLGRPYSIYGQFYSHDNDFIFDYSGIFLLPEGNYKVKLKDQHSLKVNIIEIRDQKIYLKNYSSLNNFFEIFFDSYQ